MELRLHRRRARHPVRAGGHAAGLALRRRRVIVVTWAALRGVRPDRRTWPRLALVGLLCQCLYLGGVVTGVGLGVPPGTAALVAALQPLLVAVVAGPLLGERTSVRQRVGLVLGVVGVALVVASDLGAGAARAAGLRARGRRDARRCRPAPCSSAGCALPVSLLESLTVQTADRRGLLHDGRHPRRAPRAAGGPAVLVVGAVGGRRSRPSAATAATCWCSGAAARPGSARCCS